MGARSRPLQVVVRLTDLGTMDVTSLRRHARRLDAAGVLAVVLDAASPDPLVTASFLARVTSRVGLVVATDPSREHPYNVARRIASLDHLSHGRAAWLAQPDPKGQERTDAALRTVRELWRTWPIESLVGDRDGGVFADGSQLRVTSNIEPFRSRGPLCVPTTPQGEPTIWWNGDPDASAPDSADVFVTAHDALPADGVSFTTSPNPDQARSALEAAMGTATGVVVDSSLEDLGALIDLLPVWRAAGLVAQASSGTLRSELGIARRLEPDLSGAEPAYAKDPS